MVGKRPTVLAACAEWGLPLGGGRGWWVGGRGLVSSIFALSIPSLFFSRCLSSSFLVDGFI